MNRPMPKLAIRQISRWLVRAVSLSCLLAGVAELLPAAHGQNVPSQPHPMLPQPIGQAVSGDGPDAQPGGPHADERLLRALNADRQKSLVNDTNKLLRLVNELNAEIARTSPAALTPEQVRKLAEIEKLARNVREKMATSVRDLLPFEAPFQPPHN